jgi:dipeptidyl aminopeptidase/acylaminoacyl peptidase
MTRTFSLARPLALACLFFAGALHAQEVLPLDYFTRSDETGTIKLSPQGDYVAITTGQHGAEFLRFVNLDNPKQGGAAIRAPDGLAIFDFYWASNTRVVFMIAERQPGQVAPAWTGQIYAVDRDGTRQALIYGYRAQENVTGTHLRVRQASYATPEVVSLLDSDDRNIVITEMPWKLMGDAYYYDPDAKPTITKLDIHSGKEARLGQAPLAGATVIVDRDDVPRFAVGDTADNRLAVAWRRTKDADAWEEFELPDFREDTVVPIRFTADNSAVLFFGVRTGQRYRALFQFTLADHSIKQLIDIPDADVLDIVTDFQDRDVIGVTGYTDKLVYRWLLPDHPAARLQQALQRAFAGNEVRFLNHSADGKRAIVFVNSDVAPGEYFLLNTETKQADMIRTARSWIDLEKMRPREPIELQSRDGLPLRGYLTRPAGDGPHPLIVLPHGGPHGIRDYWTFDSEAQLFANRGYAVLQLNFRGSGGYGIDFQYAGYREWGAKMQDDLTDATKWAIDKKITTADRICIYGGSYGGYAALMGVVREPKLYRCAIGYAGVYDLQLMYETGDIPRSKSGGNYLNLVLGNDPAELRARSPAAQAAKIEVPVFLIHGKEDFRADYQQATRMKTELEKAGKAVEWIALRGEGHGVYDDETRKELYEAVLKFLEKNLKQPKAE